MTKCWALSNSVKVLGQERSVQTALLWNSTEDFNMGIALHGHWEIHLRDDSEMAIEAVRLLLGIRGSVNRFPDIGNAAADNKRPGPRPQP